VEGRDRKAAFDEAPDHLPGLRDLLFQKRAGVVGVAHDLLLDPLRVCLAQMGTSFERRLLGRQRGLALLVLV